jgi:hypothetical protein
MAELHGDCNREKRGAESCRRKVGGAGMALRNVPRRGIGGHATAALQGCCAAINDARGRGPIAPAQNTGG